MCCKLGGVIEQINAKTGPLSPKGPAILTMFDLQRWVCEWAVYRHITQHLLWCVWSQCSKMYRATGLNPA